GRYGSADLLARAVARTGHKTKTRANARAEVLKPWRCASEELLYQPVDGAQTDRRRTGDTRNGLQLAVVETARTTGSDLFACEVVHENTLSCLTWLIVMRL